VGHYCGGTSVWNQRDQRGQWWCSGVLRLVAELVETVGTCLAAVVADPSSAVMEIFAVAVVEPSVSFLEDSHASLVPLAGLAVASWLVLLGMAAALAAETERIQFVLEAIVFGLVGIRSELQAVDVEIVVASGLVGIQSDLEGD
jgi:hypothetical protein